MHTIRYTSACLHRTECCFFPIPHTHHLSTGIRLMISYSRKAPPKAAAATAIYFTPAGIGESYMKQIQEWLGHSDFSTTANIYAHLEYSSKVVSADAMLAGLGIENRE